MRWQARVGPALHQVELTRRSAGLLEASVDGRVYRISLTEPQPRVYSMLEGGRSHEAIVDLSQGRCRVRLGAQSYEVIPEDPSRGEPARAAGAHGRVELRAVMPGRVVRVMVSAGRSVAARQGVVVLEAMKMENELTAPRDGVVREVRVAPGQAVENGDLLVVID